MATTTLLCCDWGTTNFRLYAYNLKDQVITSSIEDNRGVASLNKEAVHLNDIGRQSLFTSYLKGQIEVLETQTQINFTGVSIILSGMASSSIGMTEVPYCDLPFNLINPVINGKYFPASGNFNHDMYLFGGLKSDNDIMRGEEVQMLGLIDFIRDQEATVILPGTHSKHIHLVDQRIVDFKTFMTGELFHLLSEQSILKNSLESFDKISSIESGYFINGVFKGSEEEILNELFTVRTNDLLKGIGRKSNYAYLSGLLIGQELKHVFKAQKAIYLCNSGASSAFYRLALETLNHNKVTIVPKKIMLEALPKAQFSLYKNFNR